MRWLRRVGAGRRTPGRAAAGRRGPGRVGLAAVRAVAGLLAALAALIAAAVPQDIAWGQDAAAHPETPAFTFLDTNPSRIARPSTPRALGMELLSAIDSAGRVQQGVAIDFAPWSLIPGLAISLSDYQSDLWRFILANAQLSLGTVRSAGDAAATDLGLGLRLTLWDAGDPMRDTAYTDSLRAGQRRCADQHLDQPGGAAAFEACIDAFLPEARRAWQAENWNGAAVSVAAAGGWRLSGSRPDQGDWLGLSSWLTGALPLTRYGQLLGQLRYDVRELDEGAGDALSYGARLLLGTARFNAFAQLTGRSLVDAEPGEDDFTAEWAAGAEFRVAEDLWLTAGLGEALSVGAGAVSQIAVILGVRLQVARAPRIGQFIEGLRTPSSP